MFHSAVWALREDQDALYRRVGEAVGGGWLTANEARAAVGLPALPGGDALRAAPSRDAATGALIRAKGRDRAEADP